MIRACKRCRDGIAAVERPVDGPDVPFVICALMPPNPAQPPNLQRPAMKPTGWCGQFRLSLLALIGYGARA